MHKLFQGSFTGETLWRGIFGLLTVVVSIASYRLLVPLLGMLAKCVVNLLFRTRLFVQQVVYLS